MVFFRAWCPCFWNFEVESYLDKCIEWFQKALKFFAKQARIRVNAGVGSRAVWNPVGENCRLQLLKNVPQDHPGRQGQWQATPTPATPAENMGNLGQYIAIPSSVVAFYRVLQLTSPQDKEKYFTEGCTSGKDRTSRHAGHRYVEVACTWFLHGFPTSLQNVQGG